MKCFGNLKTYDDETRAGSIGPDAGGPAISFSKAAVSWTDADTPELGARLSYYVGNDSEGNPVALNLRPA
jgi:cold shock CspA family protein